MLQSLRNRRNRKGFTLAELLIVVAIIAVLVAIAVPLFVGSLTKAQEARDNANIRAVRGAAVVYLLENKDNTTAWPEAGVKPSTGGWEVSATVTSTGEITGMKVEYKASAGTGFTTKGSATPNATNSSDFDIKLFLTNTEVTANAQ